MSIINPKPLIPDNSNELLTMYEAKLKDVAGQYKSGCLDWLKENRPELYIAIQTAENNLNDVWNRALVGKATVNNFRAALVVWHKLQIKSIKKHKHFKKN